MSSSVFQGFVSHHVSTTARVFRSLRRVAIIGIGVWLVFIPFLNTSFARFNPDQVAVLANAGSPESVSVANYYIQQRGIPSSHLLSVDVPTHESIGRQDYEQDVVHAIRALLEKRGLAHKVRVLVTTYGIPLRVKSPRLTEEDTRRRDDAKEWQRSSITFLHELELELTRLADGRVATENHAKQPAQGNGESDDLSKEGEALVRRVAEIINDVHVGIQQLEDADKKRDLERILQTVIQRFGGMAARGGYAIGGLNISGGAGDAGQTQRSSSDLVAVQRVLELLIQDPSVVDRDQAYRIAQRYFGIVGVSKLAAKEVAMFQYRDADASLDSELSLLWWDRGLYHVSGRMPNPLYAWSLSAGISHRLPLPILFVARLDAPTPELARQMVDQALQIEQTGLAGKVYIDARGMKPGKPLRYGYYDQSLRDLAKAIPDIASYEVLLDDTERRFSRPGEAPDVGLYVGWYKLRSYEDAFTFNPGAIGYHIASGEAVSIHNPRERGWCKNALERGITATLGPVGEPYLDAFPLPTEFFGLLLSGRYSLVEAYYLSLRYLSWRMVLFGDPLYNPWHGGGLHEKVRVSGILRRDTLPTPLSEMEFADPVRVRKQLKEQRRRLLSHLR